MDLLQWPWIQALIALSTIIICYCFHSLITGKHAQQNLLPEAGGGWPLFGHLFMLSGPDPLHISLSNMADKHGPLFTIRVGPRRGLVVNSWEGAKECYKTNDVAFSTRPRTAAIAHMGYNFAMFGFSNYGPYWREMRKISTLRLLSNRKITALGPMIQARIQALMRSMNEDYWRRVGTRQATVVDLSKIFGDLTIGLMVRTVAGNVEKEMDLEQGEKWRQAVREFIRMMNVFTVSDVVPSLKWLDSLTGAHEAFRRTGKNLDAMLQAWLDEHKKLMKESGTEMEEEEEEDDFMSEMLNVADGVSQEFPVFDADTINKATCQTMMVGGVDTMTVTLTWAISLLLNNRGAMIRVQEELDRHVGRERVVQESDMENLVYTQAVMKETLRLQPPLPVNVREAGEDCVVTGHHIPAGTRLFVNAWKIQRDPRVWDNPLEFRPERFLTGRWQEVDVAGLHYELLPFGGGRRACPGIYLALRTTQLVLATILHEFELETPSGEAVDMTGSFGTTNMKATPLEVCLRPRLSPQLYRDGSNAD
ncbi:cytochrome P450 CYP82D47-like [Andrographis paniculata]|uniref:cytochrome P450 CYP82D47-like n=1 Tax=Andrographis paniculata TaxID=175694 RepID=UPI0021E72C04|nr:cytochrome P450 CYP82D47-like [Andrographis paniculata]